MRTRTCFALLGTLALSVSLSAKGETIKITIASPTLRAPIVITEKSVLEKFNVWSGPGTGGSADGARWKATSGFILEGIDEAKDHPAGLTRYEVSFLVNRGNASETAVYVALYEYDRQTDRGYVYLPAHGEPQWGANVFLIIRHVEGRWLHASREWQDAVTPLLR